VQEVKEEDVKKGVELFFSFNTVRFFIILFGKRDKPKILNPINTSDFFLTSLKKKN
jgi:hypothetical protein